ncbi:CHAT domain-containing protein [Actinokineospora sp. NPDC004072]
MLTAAERARLLAWLGDPAGLVYARQLLAGLAKARGPAVRRVRAAARDWLERGGPPTEVPPELLTCLESHLLSALRDLLWDEHLMTAAATLLHAALVERGTGAGEWGDYDARRDHHGHDQGGVQQGGGQGYDQGYGQQPWGRPRGGDWLVEDKPKTSPAGGAPAEEAWPLLRAPASVTAGEVFTLRVGLAERRDPALLSTGTVPLPRGRVELEVVVVYDPAAFAPDGWANPVRIAYPEQHAVDLRMTALDGPGLRARRQLGAAYHHGGELRGFASREIEVAARPSGTVPLFDGRVLDIRPLLDADRPDLVIVVERGEDVRGQTLLWSVRSPLPRIAPHAGPFRSDIGDDPAAFARALRIDIGGYGDDARGAALRLIGLGRRIGELVPEPVADALRALRQRTEVPSVLLLSTEPHVPWELAVLDTPEHGSPFLGATAAIGRWVLARGRPAPTPPVRVRAGTHAVITARYEGVPGWSRLPHAEAEAQWLRERYPPCEEIGPLHSAVLDALDAGPRADVLHFALHGRYDPESAQEGLVLLAESGGRTRHRFLHPDQVAALDFTRRPFVFLNACQVGAGGEVLGDYSGLARAFLAAGAAGVVAPLWNVHDAAASAAAEEFYRLAYAGVAPAEILRRWRSRVSRATRDGRPATALAYQFFGHPRLAMERTESTYG